MTSTPPDALLWLLGLVALGLLMSTCYTAGYRDGRRDARERDGGF